MNAMNRCVQETVEKGNIDFAKNIDEIETILNLEEEMHASYCVIANLQGKVLNGFTQMAIPLWQCTGSMSVIRMVDKYNYIHRA